MAITYDDNGTQTRTITERKKLAQLGPDYEMDREILDARMKGVKGPMKKPNGKPTRNALALRKWKC